jgi:trehalose-phosphatase
MPRQRKPSSQPAKGASTARGRADMAASLARLARAPSLSVMCDFDGTIAPICQDPQQVTPDPHAIGALEGLAALPRTGVTIISGRGLRDLKARIGASPHLRLMGSYGLEVDGDGPLPGNRLMRVQRLVERIGRTVARAVRSVPDARIERKTMSVALHVRGLPRGDALRAVTLAKGAIDIPGVRAVQGRSVVEWCAFTPCKATAIRDMVGRRDRQGVLCIGDDQGDVGALAMVHGWGGVAISVGRRREGIPFQVRGVAEVTRTLRLLLEMRMAHMPDARTHLASARGRNARDAKARARAHGRSHARSARA